MRYALKVGGFVMCLYAIQGTRAADDAGQKNALRGRIYGFARYSEPKPEERPDFGLLATDPNTGQGTFFPVVTGERPRISPRSLIVAYETKGGKLWTCELSDKPKPKMLVDLARPSLCDPPVWSADGKTIIISSAIYRDRMWSYKTYQINVNGAQLRELSIPESDQVWDWSSDGKSIVTVSERVKGKGRQLYLMDVSGGNERYIADLNVSTSARFSPDSNRVAFILNEQNKIGIAVYDIAQATRKFTPITDKVGSALDGFSWSADGRRFAFTTYERGAARGHGRTTDLHRVLEITDTNGNNRRRLGDPMISYLGHIDWR